MTTATGPYGRIILYAVLVAFALLFVMPAYMTVITALKEPADIKLETAWNPPRTLNWGSFVEAIEKLGPNVVNSLILASVATVLSAMLGSINGYVLSKWKFPGHDLVFTLMLFGMFIPYQIILIPLFQTLRTIHMYGGIPGLVLAHVVYGLPITTLIFRNFYTQIPNSLTESAQIDGGSHIYIWWNIVMPNVKPAWMTLIIFSFTAAWNIDGMSLIFSEELKLLPLALRSIAAAGIGRAGVGGAVGG